MVEQNTTDISSVAVDHAQHPRHLGALSHFDGHARITGPCGDTMEYWVAVQDDVIVRVGFTTDGCGASTACGSMTACLAQGKPVTEAAELGQEDILRALRPFPAESEHCALLATNTLKAACGDVAATRHREQGGDGRAGAPAAARPDVQRGALRRVSDLAPVSSAPCLR
jgi:nitrogen fixation NifU-like protein